MTKYTINVFYDSPLGFVKYRKATNAEETIHGGLQFVDSVGGKFTISHRVPWVVVEEKGEQS